MTWARRADRNQQEIVDALRQAGMSAHLTYRVGQGFPDIAVGYNGKTYLLEIKTLDGKLTKAEIEWLANWKGHATVVRDVQQALDVIWDDNDV